MPVKTNEPVAAGRVNAVVEVSEAGLPVNVYTPVLIPSCLFAVNVAALPVTKYVPFSADNLRLAVSVALLPFKA